MQKGTFRSPCEWHPRDRKLLLCVLCRMIVFICISSSSVSDIIIIIIISSSSSSYKVPIKCLVSDARSDDSHASITTLLKVIQQ